MTLRIAEELGRLFEVGFNIGILAYIQDQQIKQKFGDLYRQELQQLKFPKMLKRIVNQVISTLEREMVEKWGVFFLQKGFLSGLNFFGEYLQSIGGNQPYHLRNIQILYFQSRFSGDNSIGTYENKNTAEWFREVLRQFDNFTSDEIEGFINKYILQGEDFGYKGEFINADCLMLLRYRNQVRVLCVDLSVFSIQSDASVKNLNFVDILKDLLTRDINYLRSKSVFSELRIDTESIGLEFSEDLKNYLTAFKYKDKESTKLIQAGGYAYSFYQFLQSTGIVNEQTPLVFNVVGYSDRSLSAMSVGRENLDILRTCYEIYKHDSSGKEITDARKQVLNRIKRSTYGSFSSGKEFIDALLAIQPNKINTIVHQEQIDGFFNSVGQVPKDLMKQLGLSGNLNLRQAHESLITKALASDDTYIFLTGNPGIGKTTAIVKFLKQKVDEGFLFFYISPRTQVNLDIIEKFKDETEQLCDRRILALNTNSNLIQGNFGSYTVQYLSNEYQGNFRLQSVNFIDSRNVELSLKRSNRLFRSGENVLQDKGQTSRGVLNSISEAISTAIAQGLSNNIVATVAVQSLKQTYNGDTLKHLEKIFRTAYNKSEGKLIPDELRKISQNIKHLFIVIDEITGDRSGVEFLEGIHEIICKYQLTDPSHGFNTKVIVADASIIDKNVINQHLSDKSPEPDKIYFRRASDNFQPLSAEKFKFKGQPSIAINANSYPARSLSIKYKVVVESCRYSESDEIGRQGNFTKNLRIELFKDIQTLLNRADVEQFIVYIQNKQKLAELIQEIQPLTGSFEANQDYLEIHSNLSELDKQAINQFQNDVKVIFMTASGSRGLSFPKAKHILVEIPNFQIEQNLMEIIQVIYRGRGNDEIDNQDKELTFYLGETSFYYEDDSQSQQLSIQESVLSTINILLLLKASIATRIFGYSKIGRENFIIIPIGGKSVNSVGITFSTQLANLISQLKKEYQRDPKDVTLATVYMNLEKLLSNAEFTIRDTTESNYLELRKSFNSKFSQMCQTLDNLLDIGKIETGYISGSLLVVPISEILEETYLLRVLDIETYASSELWQNMFYISNSNSYPDRLRYAIKDAIELVRYLREEESTTQRLEQSSQSEDQYYAIPLFTFVCGEVIKEYFTNQSELQENESFRDILSKYVRLLFPVGNTLPIGHQYREFPFILFKSYSLKEIRQKRFIDKYLLTSNELNVLNLILSRSSSS